MKAIAILRLILLFPIYLSFLSYFSLVGVQLWNNEVLYQTLETPNIFHNLLILTLQHKIYYPSSLPSCNTESSISRDLRCTIAPPYQLGIHSNTSSGCLKSWIVLNPVTTSFFPMRWGELNDTIGSTIAIGYYWTFFLSERGSCACRLCWPWVNETMESETTDSYYMKNLQKAVFTITVRGDKKRERIWRFWRILKKESFESVITPR